MSHFHRQSRATRAVSVVIGVMLMMSILFLAAAQYQLVIVPQEEETTEVNHHRLVSSQLGELHADILAASSNGAQSAQKLDIGTKYEQDLIFGFIPEIHQTDPSGTVSNKNFSNQIVIKNAEGLGSAQNYWPGGLDGNECDDPDHCYETTSFHYQADYNRYESSPQIIYENTVMYEYYNNSGSPDDYQIKSSQNLVTGRTLNLVALTGDVEQQQVSPSAVQTIPVSAPSESISVKQDANNDPLTVQIPSRIPVSVWEDDILSSEMSSTPDGYVENIASCGTNCVEIQMQENQVYNMKLSRVHITTQEEQTDVPVTDAAYIAWKGNDRITIRENSTTELNAQVRDRYNNAVPGIKTEAYARDSNGDCIGSYRSGTGNSCDGNQQPGEQTSGEDGTLTYYYEAPDVDSDTAITLELLLNDSANTVAANPGNMTPQLLTATSQPQSPIRPDIKVGHLTSNNTLRITDVKFDQTSVNIKNNVTATVRFDNTGTNDVNKTVTINSPTPGFQSNPDSIDINLESGEHKRYTVTLSFENTGNQRIYFDSHSEYIGVRESSTGITKGIIKSRRTKETIQKSPNRFKDGDAITDEYQESQNIPPVTFNTTTERYESNAVGNIYEFTNIGEKNDDPTYVIGNKTVPSPQSLNVGFATERVSNNKVYTLRVNYSFNGPSNNVRYNIVNATGVPIDSQSNYSLPNTGNTEIRTFQLTNKEIDYLQSGNQLFLTVNSSKTTGNPPELRLNWVSLLSSTKPLNLSTPEAQFIPSSITSSTNTVQSGKELIVSADLQNTGTASTTKQIAVHRLERGSAGSPNIQQTKEVYINPGQTKTVQFTLYEYNPGTYDYYIGTGTTPDTSSTQVTVTHR